MAAILSSRMEQSYCTSGFFRFQARFLTSSAPIWTITHYLRMCFTQRITLYAPSVVTSMSLRRGHFQKLKIYDFFKIMMFTIAFLVSNQRAYHYRSFEGSYSEIKMC